MSLTLIFAQHERETFTIRNIKTRQTNSRTLCIDRYITNKFFLLLKLRNLIRCVESSGM
jgi:hypothetical protein